MKVYVFLAEGFETVEALAVVDVLRRAKIETTTVSITESLVVKSAQGIDITADQTILSGIEEADLLFLPGGMPGTKNLEQCETLMELMKKQYAAGKLVGAICAAPSILGHLGILKGKNATCYPGFEKDLYEANATGESVVVDGNVITGKGMGVAVDTGFKIVEVLVGKETSDSIRASIQCP